MSSQTVPTTPLVVGSLVKLSVKCPMNVDGSPANQWGQVREQFWVVLVRVEREDVWGCVNSDLRCLPMKMGSVVKFPRSRVVQVSDMTTGVTTFGVSDAVYVNNNPSSRHYWQQDRFKRALAEYRGGYGSEEAVLRALPLFLRDIICQAEGETLEERFEVLRLSVNAEVARRQANRGEGEVVRELLPSLENLCRRS